MNYDTSLLISSFDGYSDCWLPVCHGIRKYWSNCPYPVYLMTNTKPFKYPGVQTLTLGPDRGWSRQMLAALEQVVTRYVLYLQEDYWISDYVDTSRIVQYGNLMEREGLHYLRLLSKPEPDRDFPGDPRLGVIDSARGSYRTSVQMTLWRREVLLELLEPSETAWQFEINGTERSRRYGDKFLSTKRYRDDDYYWGIRYLCSAVNAGRWFRAARTYARREGLSVDFTNLPMETWWDDFKRSGRIGAVAGIGTHRLGMVARDPLGALARGCVALRRSRR
jgi:hypothetical protein